MVGLTRKWPRREIDGHFASIPFKHPAIDALPPTDQSAIREKVETFDAFTPDNDPHGERDFGAFEHNGQRFSGRLIITTAR